MKNKIEKAKESFNKNSNCYEKNKWYSFVILKGLVHVEAPIKAPFNTLLKLEDFHDKFYVQEEWKNLKRTKLIDEMLNE